jgi:predicted Zn-dependent protease
LPVAVLVGVAAVVALAFVGLGSFAGAMTGADVPKTTTVVRVAPGESLSELAARMAPGSDVDAVVAKIRELNVLSGSAVTSGQPLTVPFSR